MTRLPSGSAPAPAAQRLGRGPGRTVRGRGLRGARGVLAHLHLKLDDLGIRLRKPSIPLDDSRLRDLDPSNQLHHQRHQLPIRQLLIDGHPTMINDQTNKTKSDLNINSPKHNKLTSYPDSYF
jgi:hypothetical protein